VVNSRLCGVGTITGLDYWPAWTTGLDYRTGLLDSPKLQNTSRSAKLSYFLSLLTLLPTASFLEF